MNTPTHNLPTVPGGWTTEEITVGDRTFTLSLPANPDASLDDPHLAEAWEAGRSDPYWLYLWSAATPLADIVNQHQTEPSLRVLELGCGLGLVGLAALAAGHEVTFSDRETPAVEVARLNATENGLDRHHGLIFDWETPPSETFPLIVGSDLVYEPSIHAPLLKTVEAMLERDGEFWLGDPGRTHLRTFLNAVEESPLWYQLLDEDGEELLAPPTASFCRIVIRHR
ncbi:class I SAM-dependent methyltransferase [Calycomorphotria hydatis]|nr:methyltransferase [Calycomorphotria hydatis]